MIILEEVPDRIKHDKFNGLTLRNPQAAYTRSSSLLPDYDTSEAQQREVTTIPSSSRFKLDAKTWRAALIALCIYVFLTLTIAVPIIVLKSKDAKYNRSGHPPAIPVWPTQFSYGSPPPPPPPSRMSSGAPSSDLNAICNNWQTDSNFPNSFMASYKLPPTDCITIRSNATYNSIRPDQFNGTLSMSINNNPDESSVLFTVKMQSSSKDIRDQPTVCFDEEGDNRGISIYIPSNIDDSVLTLDVNVALPQVNSSIDRFSTSLPMFSQSFGDLRQYLTFNQLSLEGSHRPINCQSLQASQISVTNTLAPIQGSFNVTQSLCLESIKGSIITDITLSPTLNQTQPTLLSLGTGNGTINANITLNALTKTLVPPNLPVFATEVQNFDGPLHLNVVYDKASLPSPIQMKVQNNGAPSSISMDRAFQGCFNVQTKLSQVFVHDTVNSSSRTLDHDMAKQNIATGWVGWGNRPTFQVACLSFVNAISALGSVNLTFGV